ncbi:MAG: elongation factor P 5-aminopentanone reductase [Oscillospiraceae bacterium]|jgi:3-oxoacyl-[acyl-carrier protein] reductase
MKTALITGASRGIGAATARALHRDGWHVIINYHRSKDTAEALAAELGGVAVCADVSDSAQVQSMFDQIGPVDLLVNNAGISHYGLLTDVTDADWQTIFGINIDGIFHCCRCALPDMIRKQEGCIINVSSVWGVYGASCEVAYSASKAAVIGLTKALAKEVGPSNIRVNCIAPGVIDTDMILGFSEADKAVLCDETPLCRLGQPRDPAALIAFLASEQASFLTGQIIGVDGGFGL